MRSRSSLHRRRRAIASVAALAAATVLGGGLTLGPLSGGNGRAVAAAPVGEVTPRTDDSVPATAVTMFGASPGEEPDESWGIGRSLGKTAVVRYVDSGWTLAPPLQDASGAPLEGFALAHPEAGRYPTPSPLAGQMTADGSGALLGTVPGTAHARPVLIVRDSGGPFKEVPGPLPESEAGPGEVALKPGEALFGANRAPMLAALDEGGGAGALVVPVDEGGERIEDSVLHWDGHSWSREQIEVPAESSGEFQVIALGASSPGNAWLLAKLSSNYPAGSVALFRRHQGEGEPTVWRPVVTTPGGEAGAPLLVPTSEGGPSKPFTVIDGTQSQVLTVTGQGVWVDGVRSDVQASTAMFLEPEGEARAQVARSWCLIPASAPAGTPACDGSLPAALPGAGGRSFAWAGPEFGELVITGLLAGSSLRLEGGEFKVVRALGGTPHRDVGGAYGAAFSSAHEGWLGQQLLPVHLTQKSLPDQLTPWPVPFRKALLALAPQPGAPVAALGSEALAVGDRGEVARFIPGSGWRPESLLGTGQRHETPRLRAVAWPRSGRAYAVGDEGAMWLWRAESNLWEPDPAAPLNFRGNLLGVAFDPTNPARGYAVGESGVLLGFGKSWQQETLPVEGPCTPRGTEVEETRRCATWSDANFTSIAFAGSEAIVAYRVLLSTASEQYRGGLLVNSGSGWHVDQAAAAALGASTPYAVAALPDGGAAMGASGLGEGALVYERQSAGSPWQSTPTPFPGEAPGSLALFREGGALRVVASGTVPDTARLESEPPPPVGFPPNLLAPYPVETRPEQGVLRQTASGWSDEEHELNDVKEPPGEYAFYDTVYQPDPVAAVLVNEAGSQGWAVGGFVSPHPELDTADVARYPNDGSSPLGVESPGVPSGSGTAVFAIGGNAQCEAPCGLERNAGIGPDRWLANALGEAGGIHGLRDFLYTGTRLTTGHTAGPATLPVPYEEETERYAELLGGHSFPALPAPSGTDLDGSGSEATYQAVFGRLSPLPGALTPPSPPFPTYYAFSSPGTPTVKVIVLDEHAAVEAAQLTFLGEQLRGAAAAREPAIVVGNANLATLDAAHVGWAQQVTAALQGGASAYFFDAPEENVKLKLGGVPAFGSGTLGYVSFLSEHREDFHGASGFLLAEVGAPGSAGEGRASVEVKLIPDIGELALEAVDGTLLQRSQPALFDGLARRPRAGNRAHNGSTEVETDPYIPIPENCFGASCPTDLFPEYTFSSSRKGVGDFVEPVLGSTDPRAVRLVKGEPVKGTPAAEHSGLFCALNAGTTEVRITAGGLSSKLNVTVEPGSVRRPCGTVKAEALPASESAVPTPAPAPSPSPAGAAPASAPPVLPVPPAPLVPTPPTPAHPAPAPFVSQTALPAFVPAILPPPIPTPARPTPPSGTSAVSQPVEAAEKEEEEEAAPESVSNEASAYVVHEHEPSPAYLLGLVVLAAFAGAGVRRRVGRRRREIRIAPATINGRYSQRHMSGDRHRRR